jgi:hypothetical protein
MDQVLSHYFSEEEAPRVEGRCLHLLSDILMISVLTYLTGVRIIGTCIYLPKSGAWNLQVYRSYLIEHLQPIHLKGFSIKCDFFLYHCLSIYY